VFGATVPFQDLVGDTPDGPVHIAAIHDAAHQRIRGETENRPAAAAGALPEQGTVILLLPYRPLGTGLKVGFSTSAVNLAPSPPRSNSLHGVAWRMCRADGCPSVSPPS
jgi:hypothetical protein